MKTPNSHFWFCIKFTYIKWKLNNVWIKPVPRVVWRSWCWFSAALPFLAMLHLLSFITQNPHSNAKGPIDEWFRLLQQLCDGLPVLLFAGSDCHWIPRSYISHTFLHSWGEDGSVGCQDWDAHDKLRLRTKWGLSKLCCIGSRVKRQMLTEGDRMMLCHKEQTAISSHLLWTENWRTN